MNKNELTPIFEELKKVLNDKADDTKLMEELDRYINVYNIPVNTAKRAILKKFGGEETVFVTADAVVKKISELTGTEMNFDLTAKAVFVDKKEITVRNAKKMIISGILGDETGTAPFTIWEGDSFDLVKGETYVFRSAYTKTWNNKVQINLGTRGRVEKAQGAKIEVPARTVFPDSVEAKIGAVKDGTGNVTVTGRILSTEARNIIVKDEPKVVYSGIMADDTGKIQYSAWNDFGLKEGDAVCVKNAYIRSWKGIPQLNMGDRCTVEKVKDSFGDISGGTADKTVADIIKIGGALDIAVTGTVVDLRAGSGLIKRCPECNRSILNDECGVHGKVEPVFDLRMKLTVDDGTGAINAIVNRADTEKLTGITLAAATGLAKARGDMDAVGRDMANLIIMKRVTVRGNVMSDEFGPMMIVRSADISNVDLEAEAKKLYKEMEEAL